MGFSNGYDSGYSDAIADVRNGKVPGLGPVASGDGGSEDGTGGVANVPSLHGTASDIDSSVFNRFLVQENVAIEVTRPAMITASLDNSGDYPVLNLHVPTNVPVGTTLVLRIRFSVGGGTDVDDGDNWMGVYNAVDDDVPVQIVEYTLNDQPLQQIKEYFTYTSTGYVSFALWFNGTSWELAALY